MWGQILFLVENLETRPHIPRPDPMYNWHVDESPVEQAKKYVERRKGWRPERRTIEYLVVMVVVLIAAAIVIPRMLPGKILDNQALIGRDGGISVLNLTSGYVKKLIPAPGEDEGYSAWGMSAGRDEVVATWFHQAGGKVDKVSVRSMSGFSGRTHAEWALEAKGKNPKPSQVGFLPTHNIIWVLVSGKITLVDIKSALIYELPLKAIDESGRKEDATAMNRVSFSPGGEKLAYSRGNALTVLTGFTRELGRGTLHSRIVLHPGITADAGGRVINGSVENFTWLDDNTLGVVVGQQVEHDAATATPVYLFKFKDDAASATRLKVPVPGTSRVTSISGSPQGVGFALLQSGGGEQTAARYITSGKLVKAAKLGPGHWQQPLCWASH